MATFSAIRNNALALGAFAVLTAGAIAATQALTQEQIDANREQARARALLEIVPAQKHDNDLLHDLYLLAQAQPLGYQQPVNIHLARNQGRVHTVIIPVRSHEGYTGQIDLIVGIHSDASVAGVRVLRHQETPGLGDKVDLKKSDWILSFNNHRLQGTNDPDWAVKKDGGRFDQFTGATITPRAVVNAVKQALLTFNKHRAALLETGSEAQIQANQSVSDGDNHG
jgi:electron transport complex protein RnfG